MPASATVLVIDDELEILDATKWILESKGYKVYTAQSTETGARYLSSVHPNLLLIDHKLPSLSGTQWLKQVRAVNPQLPAIMITGLTSEFNSIEAFCRHYGVICLRKPLQIDLLLKTVKEVLKEPRSDKE